MNGLDWQCCLAGSSKTAPRIFIFSNVLSAKYSFYVKSIATYALTFLRHNDSVLAIVITFFKNSTKIRMNVTIDDIMETFASMFDVGHSYHHLQ